MARLVVPSLAVLITVCLARLGALLLVVALASLVATSLELLRPAEDSPEPPP